MVELLIDLLSKTIKASEADYIMLAIKLFENGLVYNICGKTSKL